MVKVGLRAHRAVWKKDDILSALFLLLFKDGDILDVYCIPISCMVTKTHVKFSHVESRLLSIQLVFSASVDLQRYDPLTASQCSSIPNKKLLLPQKLNSLPLKRLPGRLQERQTSSSRIIVQRRMDPQTFSPPVPH